MTGNYFLSAIARWNDYSGRARRAEFWSYTLIAWLIDVFAIFITAMVLNSAIDDETFSDFNSAGLSGRYPFPRRRFARVIDNLSDDGGKVIAYDIQFTEQTNAEDDNALVNSVADAGNVAWDMEAYQWLLTGKDFDSIHPSLQRQAILNMAYGLYEVVPDKLYQVRGFDITNFTVVKSDIGWIVLDPGTAAETARAALAHLRSTNSVERSCPWTWCRRLGGRDLDGRSGRCCHAAAAGSMRVRSSRIGAIVSRVM